LRALEGAEQAVDSISRISVNAAHTPLPEPHQDCVSALHRHHRNGPSPGIEWSWDTQVAPVGPDLPCPARARLQAPLRKGHPPIVALPASLEGEIHARASSSRRGRRCGSASNAGNAEVEFHQERPSPLPSTRSRLPRSAVDAVQIDGLVRSEEHTSELQSRENLVCRLLLEKKK